MPTDYVDNYRKVLERIAIACQKSGRRPYEITIIGVTKGHSTEVLSKARALGLTDLGENRVQEANNKYKLKNDFFADNPLRLHMIGHLQSNKVKQAVHLFDTIDSIDSIETARLVDSRSRELGKTTRCLIQVNTSGEVQKSGVSPESTVDFVGQLLGLENINFCGLMTIGRLDGTESHIRACFSRLRELSTEVSKQLKIQTFDVLSMGMSDDFDIAIEEGATEVRLGTAIWGPREQ